MSDERKSKRVERNRKPPAVEVGNEMHRGYRHEQHMSNTLATH
jgi:hypothetical protein